MELCYQCNAQINKHTTEDQHTDYSPVEYLALITELDIEQTKYDEKNKKVAEYGKEGVTVQRYKGLGEMNPQQLWETTMDPKVRTLKQVTIEDVVQADEIFRILMGDEVEPRREFIQEHAKDVTELDI